jgi:hypothetical protein
MERYPTRYSEKELLFGTRNSWEYYFAQPSGLSVSDALRRGAADNGGRIAGPFTAMENLIPPSALVQRARELMKRYVHVRPEILEKADATIPRGVSQNILGVHVRGTDLRRPAYPQHPIPDVVIAYLQKAKALDRRHDFSAIFLATDERETVDLFRKEFAERLLTIDAHRTDDSTTITKDYSWLFANKRKHHRYMLGMEVLLDVLLLARCAHLICGMSNISYAAIYFSTDDQHVHPIAPLWMTPNIDGTSAGLRHVKSCAIPEAIDPIAVLLAQKQEIYSLLAAAEESCRLLRREAKSHRKRSKLSALISSVKRIPPRMWK